MPVCFIIAFIGIVVAIACFIAFHFALALLRRPFIEPPLRDEE